MLQQRFYWIVFHFSWRTTLRLLLVARSDFNLLIVFESFSDKETFDSSGNCPIITETITSLITLGTQTVVAFSHSDNLSRTLACKSLLRKSRQTIVTDTFSIIIVCRNDWNSSLKALLIAILSPNAFTISLDFNGIPWNPLKSEKKSNWEILKINEFKVDLIKKNQSIAYAKSFLFHVSTFFFLNFLFLMSNSSVISWDDLRCWLIVDVLVVVLYLFRKELIIKSL